MGWLTRWQMPPWAWAVQQLRAACGVLHQDLPTSRLVAFLSLRRPPPQLCSRQEGLEALERLVEEKARELAAAGAAGAGHHGRGAQGGPGHGHGRAGSGSGRRAAASQQGASLGSQGGAVAEAADGSGAGPSGAHGGGEGAGAEAVGERRMEQLREEARAALSSQVRAEGGRGGVEREAPGLCDLCWCQLVPGLMVWVPVAVPLTCGEKRFELALLRSVDVSAQRTFHSTGHVSARSLSLGQPAGSLPGRQDVCIPVPQHGSSLATVTHDVHVYPCALRHPRPPQELHHGTSTMTLHATHLHTVALPCMHSFSG